jgi:hypothetical protein
VRPSGEEAALANGFVPEEHELDLRGIARHEDKRSPEL